MKTIAVDFDGVIHKYSEGWEDGSIYDEPIEGVREAICRLKRKGYRIVIFTTRLHPKFNEIDKKDGRNCYEDIYNWLKKHLIEFDEITNNKPPAVAYIDDRAIRFTNWRDILNYF